MLKAAPTFALHMVVGGDAVKKVVPELPEGNPVYVFVMVVARDVKRKIAQRVQKVSLVFASHMEVVVDAKPQDVLKELREAQCFVKPMVVENAVLLLVVPRVLKEAHLFVRAMEEGRGVRSRVVVSVQRVFMEGPTSVLHTGVARDVLYLSAQRVQEDGQIFVCVMVVARGASLQVVVKVHKAALISARHMVEGRDALGVILDLNVVLTLLGLVTHLQGVRQVYVHSTVALCRIRGFMVVPLWDLWSKVQIIVSLRR